MPGKTKSTIMIDSDLWKRLRVVAILNEFEISELVEEALREKLARMQQQPEQDPAYKDVENVRYKPKGLDQKITSAANVNPGVVSSRVGGSEQPKELPKQQPQQPQTQQHRSSQFSQTLQHEKEYAQWKPTEETKTLPFSEMYESRYEIFMPPTEEFPKNKNEILQIAKEQENEFIKESGKVPLIIGQTLLILEKLPDRRYKNRMDLNDELTILLNNKKIGERLLGKPTNVRGVALVDIFQTDPPMERKAVIQYLIENDYRWREAYRKERQQR